MSEKLNDVKVISILQTWRLTAFLVVDSPNYNPGGRTTRPPPSSSQLLYLQIQPRYNIYVDSESTASFLVSAGLSRTYGEPFTQSSRSQKLTFDIYVKATGQILVKNGMIAVDAMDQEYSFELSQLSPRMNPYHIVIDIISNTGDQKFTATTDLYCLPDKTSGSVTKLDGLYGGLLFKNAASNNNFYPVFGHGFYTDYGGFLATNTSAVKEYYDAGFKVVHPIASYTGGSLTLDQVWDEADALDLLWVYDMRGSFMNLTQVGIEVAAALDRETLLMWYTGDEPDGWEYGLNSTRLAYDAIRALDLYHPVSLVLNCYDFYYGPYSAGADIVMEDAYPIAINATYSYTWGIPCNSTYGDCGCDDCNGMIQDVSDRLDALATYQTELGRPYKPLYAVPQAFSDPEYWPRLPTVIEAWSMNGIALNHGAKSLYMWTYPTDQSLITAHAEYSNVITANPVLSFLVGAQPTRVPVSAYPMLDIAYWTVGTQTLVSFVNGYNYTLNGLITVNVPFAAKSLKSQPFGSMNWDVSENSIKVQGATALEHSMVVVGM